MDEETRALIREALDLYKRELDIAEASHKRQLAMLEANTARNQGWQLWTRWIALAVIIAVVMSLAMPVMDWLLHRS